MKRTLFIIGLLCLATFTNAGTFSEARLRRKHEQVLTPTQFASNLKASEFGSSLLNLISLQFKTSGQLDDVTNLLQGLKDKISGQQSSDDQKYAETSAANQAIIEDQTQTIATATQNIEVYEDQLSDAQSILAQLRATQASLQSEEQSLKAEIDTANTLRAQDAERYAARVASQEKVIIGLQNTNSVLADRDGVEDIVSLIENIITAFQASIAEDRQREDQAIQDYNDFVTRRQDRIVEIEQELAQIASNISDFEALIAHLQDQIASETATRTNAQALKDSTIAAQDSLAAKCNSNKAVRADQLNLIASAVATLTQNSKDVQQYLNSA